MSSHLLFLLPFLLFYHTAGNPFAGVARGLRCKVIRHPVNDEGFSDNFRNRKTLVIKCHPGITLVAQKRRHVAAVIRVFGRRTAVMGTGTSKRGDAHAVFVDVLQQRLRNGGFKQEFAL